jgi:hypothetical protein
MKRIFGYFGTLMLLGLICIALSTCWFLKSGLENGAAIKISFWVIGFVIFVPSFITFLVFAIRNTLDNE